MRKEIKIDSSKKEPKFVLEEFLNYNNPNLENYKRLAGISRWSGAQFDTSYSVGWESRLDSLKTDPKEADFFRKKLNGEILVDLGETKIYGKMLNMARFFGVRTYICVDINYLYGQEDPSRPVFETETTDGLQAIPVKADMLDFVARMPDESANFVLNGIDSTIISDIDYKKALCQELLRTTKRGGIIFGISHGFRETSGRFVSDNPEVLDMLPREGRVKLESLDEFVFEKK